MPSTSQLKTVLFTLAAIMIITRVDMTKDLLIGKRSFF